MQSVFRDPVKSIPKQKEEKLEVADLAALADGLGTSPRTEKIAFQASHILTIEYDDQEIAEELRKFISVVREVYDVEVAYRAFISWGHLTRGAGSIEIGRARKLLLSSLRFPSMPPEYLVSCKREVIFGILK